MSKSPKVVFISHSSADKPFVFRLAFELMAEGVPVWLDAWELGPGDPLITSLDSALDGSAQVLVVVSSHSAQTKWVKHEVQKTIEAEERLGQRLLVPLRIDNSIGLEELKGRIYFNLTEGAGFMDGVHALRDHLRSLGLSGNSESRPVLPLAFDRDVELDTFTLERIFSWRIGNGLKFADITAQTMHLLKSEKHNKLQRNLRARISTYWSGKNATAGGLNVLRSLDEGVARMERDIRERSALILREFGGGFAISNSAVVEVVRWYTRAAMHNLLCSLEAIDICEPETTADFAAALESLPTYSPEPSTAQWWQIDDAIQVCVHHRDAEGRYHITSPVLVPRGALKVSEDAIEDYPGLPFHHAFAYDALSRYVLPQMVLGAPLGLNWSPATWDEDNFGIWQHNN